MAMDLPTTTSDTWFSGLDLPSRLFGTGREDYELFEEDGEFVLSIEMPGFAPDEIDVNWYDGRLNVAAEHEEETRNAKKTYHRTFRLPKEIEPEDIAAEYTNGVLEVRLPILEGAAQRGHTIEVEG